MKFHNFDIVFREIPDEVTLAVNITGCPFRCVGCHSPHLREDIGEVLDESAVDRLLDRYAAAITCFCFMGGDACRNEVEQMARHIRARARIKIGWYSGGNAMPLHPDLFDYVKTGAYIPDKGGLDTPGTNQRMFRRNGHGWEDITARFLKKKFDRG